MAKCSCGAEILGNAEYCPNCGKPLKKQPEGANKVTPYGIVGFVLSIVLAVLCPSGMLPSYGMMFIIAIPSVVFCIIGVNDKKNAKHGLAIAGLVIATLAILVGGVFKVPK